MTSACMTWTEEAVTRPRPPWSEGHSTAEIGRRMGVTRAAAPGRYRPPRKLGLRFCEVHTSEPCCPKRRWLAYAEVYRPLADRHAP